MTEPKYRYFKCTPGHAVPRYGSRGVFIASHREPGGFVFNKDEVVAIPETEIAKYSREYLRAIRCESLVEVAKKDYENFVKDQEEQSKKDSEKRLKKTQKENKDKKTSGKSTAGNKKK